MIFNFDGTPIAEKNQPYSDEYMTYDKATGRYILTSKFALDKYGLELYGDVNDRNSTNAQIAANALLKRVSTLIYNFIHDYGFCNAKQDFLIAHNDKLRAAIQQAMGEQLVYMSANGDLSRSTDREKRALAIDETAKQILINSGICYSGV